MGGSPPLLREWERTSFNASRNDSWTSAFFHPNALSGALSQPFFCGQRILVFILPQFLDVFFFLFLFRERGREMKEEGEVTTLRKVTDSYGWC